MRRSVAKFSLQVEPLKSAVIKDLDEKQLANELPASVLAHAAALPTPVALIRGSDLVVNIAPRTLQMATASYLPALT
jgi:hypothetical protein